jgi:hypothetical protein
MAYELAALVAREADTIEDALLVIDQWVGGNGRGIGSRVRSARSKPAINSSR